MTLFDLMLIAFGLSMDACAVAMVNGMCMPELNKRNIFLIAMSFGLFQAGMPVIGYVVGGRFAETISDIDHWIALALLAAIGGKMIWDAFHEEEECETVCEIEMKSLFSQSVATSIDALAIGVGFAATQVKLVPAISLIGITTFVLSLISVYVGKWTCGKLTGKAQLVGGVILILIGIKIVIEHIAQGI
ncbi:MAG: manganese efflux pump [Firmicutes bacterium]|nr:manganese efflux pump [Bacillota bacterium]